MILETKDFGIRSQNFAHRACSGRKTDAGLLPIRIEMQTLKETIRSWAQETARHRKSKQDGTGQGFGETMNEIAAQALDCFLQLPDPMFDPDARSGMFGEKVSLWKELGSPDFTQRDFPLTQAPFPESFRCDIKGLDVYQILLYNGRVCGPEGKNLLDPASEAVLDGHPCVCRLDELAATETHKEKLQPFLDEARQALCRKETTTHVKDTADFAQGGRDAAMEQSKWLNRCLSAETLIIYMPKGARLDKPLQIVSLCHGEKPSFVASQIWVLMEEGASLSLVECTDSHPKAEVMAHSLTEIRLEKEASLEYIQLQNVGDSCKVFHDLSVQQARSSRLASYNLTLNGGLTRNNLEVNLNQEEARAELLGLYLQDHEQMAKTQVKVNHKAPKTYSRELFKGVIDDSASAYFKGHVFVSPVADQTEAYQSNRNLLISPKAQAHAKPYLEIYADDVQCNHGVTVGQLDEDALFYMRCRGIPADTARRLLMRAYADEILKPISVDSLREWMTFLVKKRFSGQLQACEQCVLACPEKKTF